MKALLIASVIASSLFYTSAASADASPSKNSCDLELNNELLITPKHILIKENDETLIDIYEDKMVFIKGDMVTLSKSQQKLVHEYAAMLRKSIPEIGEIAIEAVDLAFQGIQAAFGPIEGNQKINAKFKEVKQKIKQRYEDSDGYYSFSEGNFNHHIDGNGIDESIEEIMEEMIPVFIGGLISNIGNSIANGGNSLENLDNIGERIEQEIEAKSDHIEQKAHQFCESLKVADGIENELVASDSNLKHFDLLNIKYN